MKVIRMYDAGNETLISDFSARSGSPITSLTSDQVAGHYFVAGFGDGAVRAYDTRLDNRNPLVRAWKHHKSWIVNVHMQRGGIRELVTGSIAGEVKLFEYRLIWPFLMVVFNKISQFGRFRLIRLRCDVLLFMNMLLFSRLDLRVRVSRCGIWTGRICLLLGTSLDFSIRDGVPGLRG